MAKTKPPGPVMLAFLDEFTMFLNPCEFEDLAHQRSLTATRSLIRRATIAGWIEARQGGKDARTKVWRLTKKGAKAVNHG